MSADALLFFLYFLLEFHQTKSEEISFKTLKPTSGHGATQLRGEREGLANKIFHAGKNFM